MSSSVTTNLSFPDHLQVGIVCRLDNPGGVQSVAVSLIHGLNRQGIVPTVLWDVPPDKTVLAEKNAKATFERIPFLVNSQFLDRLPISLRYFLRIANCYSNTHLSTKFDFLYIFYNGFLVTDHTPHIRYLSGPPLLPQLDMVSPGLRGLPYRLFRWIYQHAARKVSPIYEFHAASNYVINSNYTKTLFHEAHGISLPVVYPPIDIKDRSFTHEDLDSRDSITFFSRFVDYKRPERVLDLAARYPDQRFVLMGGVRQKQRPYFNHLVEQAKKQQLKNVVFIENPSDERVAQELKRSRFFVFPTINEHFGIVTVEAIASGVIPYVHDSGGQKEIVNDPRLRFTDAEFFNKFEQLYHLSPANLNQIREQLHQHIQQFSEDSFIEKMLAYLEQPEQEDPVHELQTSALSK